MSTTNTPSNKEDRELKREQIKQLSSADALVAFFADLGYNTNARVKQTTKAMGITDADLVGSIKNVERLAKEEILPFEIYLFELKSLTIARRQALMRYFLKRPGDILGKVGGQRGADLHQPVHGGCFSCGVGYRVTTRY